MTKKLQIKLLPNGEIQMETQGGLGKKFLDYIEIWKKSVDVKILDTQLSQEYYETEQEEYTPEKNNINIKYD